MVCPFKRPAPARPLDVPDDPRRKGPFVLSSPAGERMSRNQKYHVSPKSRLSSLSFDSMVTGCPRGLIPLSEIVFSKACM